MNTDIADISSVLKISSEFNPFNLNDHNITSMSQYSSDKYQSKLSLQGDWIFGGVLIFTGLLSLFGNGTMLAIFYFRRRQLNPAEIFLVNLGLVDILLSIASYPCAMISSFNHRWLFGSTGCTIYAFTCYFLGVASLASLTAIAIIRFLKTCSPTLGNQINGRSSLKIIVWVYVYALFWAFLPLIGFSQYEVEPFALSCTLDWTAPGILSRVYIVLVSIFCVFIPTFIIVYCYGNIVLLVRRSDQLIGDKRIRGASSTNISEVQLTWMSLIITLGFIIGWMPYTVVSLYGSFTHQLLLPMWLTPAPVLLAKSSIAYNPIIYIFLTKRYRDDFMKLIRMFRACSFRRNIFESTTTLGDHNVHPPIPTFTNSHVRDDEDEEDVKLEENSILAVSACTMTTYNTNSNSNVVSSQN